MQVIKLSDAVQHLPRESTLFVHGVPPCFLSVGDKMAAAAKQVSNSLVTVCLLLCGSVSLSMKACTGYQNGAAWLISF